MEVFEYGDPSAKLVLIQMVGEHDAGMTEIIFEGIKENTGAEFRMVCVKVDDWNADLSPWQAPAVFAGPDFGGGAEFSLKKVYELVESLEKEKLLNQAESAESIIQLKQKEVSGKRYIIGGYSLAGLFALWASYQIDIFSAVAAASPSMWFPGFTDYMKAHEIRCPIVYLSLGDKEEKTRNPIMRTVGDRMREAYQWLADQGIDCTLEWNQGNHFKDADVRVVKAFSKAVEMLHETDSGIQNTPGICETAYVKQHM